MLFSIYWIWFSNLCHFHFRCVLNVKSIYECTFSFFFVCIYLPFACSSCLSHWEKIQFPKPDAKCYFQNINFFNSIDRSHPAQCIHLQNVKQNETKKKNKSKNMNKTSYSIVPIQKHDTVSGLGKDEEKVFRKRKRNQKERERANTSKPNSWITRFCQPTATREKRDF